MADSFGAPIRPDKPVYQWDATVPGLGIRINRDGTRCYVVRVSSKGDTKSFTVGPVDLFELEDVRRLVGRMKLLAKAGKDAQPALNEFLRQQAMPDTFSITFGAFSKVYIEQYAKVHKQKSCHKDEGMINFHLLPRWRDKPMCQITRLEVSDIHTEIGRTRPFAANRLLELIQVMWKQAVILGYLPDRHIGIATGIRRFKEPQRDRLITEAERDRIMQALDCAKGNRWQIAALKLDIETGFRCGEIIALKWDSVNLDRAEITLPDTKAGRPFTQPLTKKAVDLLASLPRFNEWVFPSHVKKGHHIARVDKLFKTICASAGVENIRPHDIRHMVGSSVLAQTGSLEMVAAVLNHSSLQSSKIYAKYQKEHVRQALEAHSSSRGVAAPPEQDELSRRRDKRKVAKS